MATRLLLGCGTVGRAVVDGMTARRGDLFVVDPDPDRIEALRDENVAAEQGEPDDPSVFEGIEEPVSVVVVGGDDPGVNRRAARAAREAFPSAHLVVYASGANAEDREAMAEVADRLLDPAGVVAERALAAVEGDVGSRLRGLKRALRGVSGTLGVVMHDNPDPDAIGSAMALRELAKRSGVHAEACYFGEIAHQENRALVNLLDIDLRQLDAEAFDPAAFDAIALVDHSRPGVNDQLPEGIDVAVIVDHHPPREPVTAEFVDLRSDVGATSTLLAGYFDGFGVDPSPAVASALLYGIRVDTRDFGREITETDFEAAAFLLPHADVGVLNRVENPNISGDTFETIARAIEHRERRGPVIVSGVGRINDRDALAQAAERLLGIEGVTVTMVYGHMEGTVFASARTLGTDIDIGEAMRDAFDRIGSAGGHADMAGAQLPLGILGDLPEDTDVDSLDTVISDVISNRFFEVLGIPEESGVPDLVDDARPPETPETRFSDGLDADPTPES